MRAGFTGSTGTAVVSRVQSHRPSDYTYISEGRLTSTAVLLSKTISQP